MASAPLPAKAIDLTPGLIMNSMTRLLVALSSATRISNSDSSAIFSTSAGFELGAGPGVGGEWRVRVAKGRKISQRERKDERKKMISWKYFGGEFIEFKNTFKKIKNNLKQEGIKLAKKKIKYRLSGIPGVKSDLITSEISSFGNKFLPSLINKKSKKKNYYISS